MFHEYLRLFIAKLMSPLMFVMAKYTVVIEGYYYYLEVADTVTTKPKAAVFRRIKKAVTRMRRQ